MAMPDERETWGERALRELLGSEARAKIIAWICSRPAEAPIVGAKLARELHLMPNAVWLELDRLARLGMVEAGEKVGRAKPYYLNQRFPLLPGLRSIVQYATGVVALLREQLSDRDDIDVAFVYGSLAAGDDRPESDVDLMVIGEISGRDLSSAVGKVERATRREINQMHYSREEFSRRRAEGGSFLPTVLDGPKVFVKGDEDALRALAP
jgi:predicted nucleotidyltransferase